MFDNPPPPATAIATTAARLSTILAQLATACQRRSTVPVLTTVLIQATPTGTTFTTTDLDLTIQIEAEDLTSAAPWATCAPFDLLRRLAATLTGPMTLAFAEGGIHPGGKIDQITLTTEDGISATANLICPATDFPVLPKGLDDPLAWHFLTLSPTDLRRHVDLAAPCVSTEETRYYLNGIYLCRKPDGTTLRAVATDGHRMAVIDGPTDAPEGISAIVPLIAIRAMTRLITRSANEPVTLMLHRETTRMRLVAGPIRIDCKTIDGKFPDYTKVIPTADTRTIVTVTQAALRCLAPFYTANSYGAKFSDGRVSLRNTDFGEISGPAPMLHLPTDEAQPVQKIGFNFRYLQTQSQLTKTFCMELTGSGDPARVRGTDPDAMWILMPMRV